MGKSTELLKMSKLVAEPNTTRFWLSVKVSLGLGWMVSGSVKLTWYSPTLPFTKPAKVTGTDVASVL